MRTQDRGSRKTERTLLAGQAIDSVTNADDPDRNPGVTSLQVAASGRSGAWGGAEPLCDLGPRPPDWPGLGVSRRLGQPALGGLQPPCVAFDMCSDTVSIAPGEMTSTGIPWEASSTAMT